MLIKLKLKNVALIEIIEINFEKGLNILTGDSGSGKSLILDSLNVLFGGTNIPLKHLIRPEKEDCLIEAIFYPTIQVNDWLMKNGFENCYSQITVRRKSYKNKKKIFTKYTLNDVSISKKLLQEIGLLLIDFAGQSDILLFSSSEYKKSIIDDLGSEKLKQTNQKIKNIWKKSEGLKQLMREKIDAARSREENDIAIKEMFKILDEANLQSASEMMDLESLENRLANNFEITNSVQLVLNNLNNFSHEQPSIGFLISQSLKQLNKVGEYDAKLQEFTDKLLSIQNDLENLNFELNSYITQFESSDINLDEIQKRLFFLKNLERTFLLEIPQLIKKRDQLKKHISTNNFNEDIKKLNDQIKNLQSDLNSLFQVQSSERKKVANNLQYSVMKILRNLGLHNAKFLIDFEKVNPSIGGSDNIEFLFSANPDQKLAPLSKVISGGEMSRFLLAIKSSISSKPNTFFLDEIDNGLSGKSLFSLVNLIKCMSCDQQVLCITHQPFLAAAGKAHFKVKKNVINGLTYTSISKLTTKKDRQNELTELIGGGFLEANDYASTLLERAAA